jgi:hypothetical protein
VPPARHVECSGTACQGPPAPPPPFAAPSTIAFDGPGNPPASRPLALGGKEAKSGKAKAKRCAGHGTRKHARCVKSKRVKRKPAHRRKHKASATVHERKSGRREG